LPQQIVIPKKNSAAKYPICLAGHDSAKTVIEMEMVCMLYVCMVGSVA